MNSSEVSRSIRLGSLFQMPMMGIYIGTVIMYLYDRTVPSYSPWNLPNYVGTLLFIYCLILLYVLKAKDNQLLITGPFQYTRHPMYTGLVLMNTVFWLPSPVSTSWLFLLSQVAFITCLVMAAYFQEKETLARFGKSAEDYYAKTPRLFFLYPWVSQRP